MIRQVVGGRLFAIAIIDLSRGHPPHTVGRGFTGQEQPSLAAGAAESPCGGLLGGVRCPLCACRTCHGRGHYSGQVSFSFSLKSAGHRTVKSAGFVTTQSSAAAARCPCDVL